MDEKRRDLRTDLKTALREAAEEAGGLGPHPGMARLIAYRQGTLPAGEREDVQEHLSLCARCTGLLRELRDFEAAAAGASGPASAGPEALREEAWEALVRRLPAKAPAVRPFAAAPPAPASQVLVTAMPSAPALRRSPRLLYAAAAGLLLALLGLALWTAAIQRERQRLVRIEQRLEERAAELAAKRRELTRPEGETLIGAALQLSVTPRFLLRGAEEGPAVLRGNGEVNPVRLEAGGVTVALSLADPPPYGEYRLELLDRNGKALLTEVRPGASLLGDAGTLVSIIGLAPGRYRLRIHGLGPGQGNLLGEYLLEAAEAPR